MPVISVRFRDADIAPIQAFADTQIVPLSRAIKQLAKLGLSYLEDGATQWEIANRSKANLQWTIEAVMILRLLSTAADKTILPRAQAAGKVFYTKHVPRT